MSLGNILGGKERVQAMLAGQGVSLILKSVNINFGRPVTFPDTVFKSDLLFSLSLVDHSDIAAIGWPQGHNIVKPHSIHFSCCPLFLCSTKGRSGFREHYCLV